MTDNEIIATYGEIERINVRMVTAARNSEWDTLVALERECNPLFLRIMSGDISATHEANFFRRKAEVVKRLLENDAEIRHLVEPWLQQLAILIDHNGQQRRLSRAYLGGT